MKKLIVLIVAVLVLGAIYIWVLPLVGIDTSAKTNDPYARVVKEKQRILGNREDVPPKINIGNADPDIENKDQPTVTLVAKGQLVGANSHKAKGNVEVFSVGNQHGIRYSDFSFDTGPDLHVYLTNSMTINTPNAVDLGAVSKTSGMEFYGVPPGVNIKQYRYIAVWSVSKKELFNYAEISSK